MHWLAAVCPLALGLVLLLLAGRRGWAPPAALALAAGVVLRVAVLVVATDQAGLPYDFSDDLAAAGRCVTSGRDPLFCVDARSVPGLSGEDGGWHLLPAMAYVSAVGLRLSDLLHVPWPVAGRLVPVAADLLLAVLVGRLAGREKATARFQYACNPLAVLVCALHGQTTPVALVFAMAALLAARGRRARTTGVLLGMSIAIASWPAILLPGVVARLPDWRRRTTALLLAVLVPAVFFVSSTLLLDSSLRQLPDAAGRLLPLRGLVGNWGWGIALSPGDIVPASPAVARVGLLVALVAVLAAVVAWRRANPVELCIATPLAFLAATPIMQVQYLLWPTPFLTARPTETTPLFLVAGSLWAVTGYLYLAHVTWAESVVTHGWWSLGSLGVIAAVAATLPWDRRRLVHARHAAPSRNGRTA